MAKRKGGRKSGKVKKEHPAQVEEQVQTVEKGAEAPTEAPQRPPPIGADVAARVAPPTRPIMAPPSQVEEDFAASYEVPEDMVWKPLSYAEKNILKARKKIRAVKKIEEAYAMKRKLEPGQLAKVERKAALEQELRACEQLSKLQGGVEERLLQTCLVISQRVSKRKDGKAKLKPNTGTPSRSNAGKGKAKGKAKGKGKGKHHFVASTEAEAEGRRDLELGARVSFEARFNPQRVKWERTKCSGAYGPPPDQSRQGGGGANNLFVGGLPLDITEELLYSVFGQYGIVKQLKVLPDNGKGDRAALVRMADPSVAQWLVSNMNGTIPQGMSAPVKVMFSKSQPVPGKKW